MAGETQQRQYEEGYAPQGILASRYLDPPLKQGIQNWTFPWPLDEVITAAEQQSQGFQDEMQRISDGGFEPHVDQYIGVKMPLTQVPVTEDEARTMAERQWRHEIDEAQISRNRFDSLLVGLRRLKRHRDEQHDGDAHDLLVWLTADDITVLGITT